MAPRFYANPFVKDAPLVAARHRTEWHYVGKSHRCDGTFDVWTRHVTYSDGSTQDEEREQPIAPIVEAGRVDLKMYEDDGSGNGDCRHCRRPLAMHSGPTWPPDLCPYQAR